ncbi:MAG: hypothetical protein M9941_16830, partial [Anaerolineae bacterium]|nr:hypothetical protein [Anaerolineae bacterium]
CYEDLSIGESSNKYAKAISMIGTSQESVLVFENDNIDIEEAMTAGVPSKNICRVISRLSG